MKLWMLTIRPLGITSAQRQPSVLRVVCNSTTERDLMEYLYDSKMTRQWWGERIVLAIEGPYDLWHIEEAR